MNVYGSWYESPSIMLINVATLSYGPQFAIISLCYYITSLFLTCYHALENLINVVRKCKEGHEYYRKSRQGKTALDLFHPVLLTC